MKKYLWFVFAILTFVALHVLSGWIMPIIVVVFIGLTFYWLFKGTKVKNNKPKK